MPQRGIQPLLNTMRVVMRNGASFEVATTLRRSTPYVLTIDTTTNPKYTGESTGLSLEDARMQKVLSRYEGFVEEGGEGGAEGGEAAGSAPSSSGSGGGGKQNKKK